MSEDDKKELVALVRGVIREELDKYDRDKGITPRMSSSGVHASQGKPNAPYDWPWR